MKNGVLTRLRFRLAGWLVLRNVLTLLAAVGLVVLGLLLADAALDLPEPIRVAAPWIAAAVAGAILVIAWWQWRQFDERKTARMFERTEPALGDRLTNAVEFAHRSGTSGVEEFLRREAVALGGKTAAGLKAWPVLRRGVKLAAATLFVAVVAWLGFVTLGDDIMTSVVPRFLDPRGDHPPYSKCKIDVAPGQAEILFGGQLEVRATASGRPVDKLWLVARTQTNSTRTIMFLAPDKSFFQTLANLREPAEYFVTDGHARSRRFPIQIRYTPQITMVELTTTFPAYTGKAARTGKLADDVEALPANTRLAFRVASNRPLTSGSLTLTPVLGGKPVEILLQPGTNQENAVAGEFTLVEPVAFSLAVRDNDGLASADSRSGRFNILPDERPRLVVLEPGRNAVATPTIRIPVKVQAQDDYGIAHVVWLRGHNRSIERPFSMKITPRGGPQSVESAGILELDKLGVRPGDVIEYFFEAADNYPQGPNVALSRLYKLEIISEEQYQEVLRRTAARKALFEPYLTAGAWLRRLAERARGLEAEAAKGDPAAAEHAEELAEQLQKYERELSKLLANPLMFDVEQSFRNTLVAQHTRVGAARQKLDKALASGQPDPKQMKELAEELSQLAATEKEEVEQPAQQIATVVQLLSRADAFVNLAQQQNTLAQMLRRFAENTNALSRIEQMEVQELAHQEQRIQDALHTLLTQILDSLSQVPAISEYDLLRKDANEFVQAVVNAKIQHDLADATKSLGEPDTVTGHALAQRAAQKMNSLIGKCDGLPKQGQQALTARFQPKLSKPGLGNTLDQIMSALNSGNGEGGRSGYGMFSDDVALYGPNVELAGERAGGRQEADSATGGRGRQTARIAGEAQEASPAQPGAPNRVRLQPDAKFPLRYRDLVGEYFRAIAESGGEGAKQ